MPSIQEEMAQRLEEVNQKRREERERAQLEPCPFKVGDLVEAIGNGWCTPGWVKENSPAEVLSVHGSRHMTYRWRCGLTGGEPLVVPLTNSWKLYECKKCGATEFETTKTETASEHLGLIRTTKRCAKCGTDVE